MTNYNAVYQKLKEQYTDEEIAESFMIPADLTPEERAVADAEMRTLRFQLLQNMTDEDRVLSDLMRLRHQIAEYIDKNVFSSEKTFGKYLAEYLHIVKKNKRDFAHDIGLHYTRLSRILNDREEPNIELTYRLEQHSGQCIPAVLWWKLMIKKQEHLLKKDEATRATEAQKVKNALSFGAR